MLQAQLPRAPSAGTLELNTRSSPFPAGPTSGPSDVESHPRGGQTPPPSTSLGNCKGTSKNKGKVRKRERKAHLKRCTAPGEGFISSSAKYQLEHQQTSKDEWRLIRFLRSYSPICEMGTNNNTNLVGFFGLRNK